MMMMTEMPHRNARSQPADSAAAAGPDPNAQGAASRGSETRRRMEREIPIMGANKQEVLALYEESNRHRDRYRGTLHDLETSCFFVGYPRSGHSLVGALLDAHPDVVMAHELNVMKYVAAGFDREQISYLLIENARRCGEVGRAWGPYDYRVAGQWQGRFRTIRVLGDKKGARTTGSIMHEPARLQKLIDLFERRVRFLHVIRNPFDVIATVFRKSSMRLPDAIRYFFRMAKTNETVCRTLGPQRILNMRHERLVSDPAGALSSACNFLGVKCDPGYLESCSAVVATSAVRSRDAVVWTPQITDAVERQFKRFDFLDGYRFAD